MNTFSRRPWLKIVDVIASYAIMATLFGINAFGQAVGSNGCDLKFEKKLSLTAQYENNLPKDLVTGTGTQASVKMYQGVPTLHVNDRPVYAMLMIPSCYTWDGKNEEITNSCRDFAAAGINMYGDLIGNISCLTCSGWWLAEDHYDFTIVDQRIHALMGANPNALILLRIDLSPPQWWLDKHPEQHSHCFKDGKTFSSGCVSIASELWENDYEAMMRNLIRHIETSDYADHLFGYMPSGGGSGEWFWPGQELGNIDYGPAARDRFRKWLKQKYADDGALQTAWRTKDVTLDTAVFPDLAASEVAECLTFRNPREAARYLDSRQFLIDMVTRNVIKSCTIVKEETKGRKLAGVFYGYSLHFAGRTGPYGEMANSGQNNLKQVLASPMVDFVSTPINYGFRRGAQSGNLICPYTASLYLHNKMFFDEEDIRTYLLGDTDFKKMGLEDTALRVPTLDETIKVLQRGAGWSLTKGNALWWFLLAGNATFHQEDIMQTVSSLNKIGQASLDADKTPIREVAIFADEVSLNYLARGNHPVVTASTAGSYEEVTRMGAPFDLYVLQDIAMANLPDYKMYVFLNAYYTTPDLRRAIAAKVRKNNAVAVWLYAPGFVTDDGFSEAAMQELTGITIRHEVKKAMSTLKLVDDSHPITAPVKTSPCLSPVGFAVEMGPRFWVEDPAAKTLGECEGRAALVVKEEKDWRSVYSAFPLTKELWQGICDYAGVHVYSRDYDVFFANRSFAMLHASSAGKKTILLPGSYHVTELITGKDFGRGLSKIETTVSPTDTLIFRLDPTP
jgi:hypothetical protein